MRLQLRLDRVTNLAIKRWKEIKYADNNARVTAGFVIGEAWKSIATVYEQIDWAKIADDTQNYFTNEAIRKEIETKSGTTVNLKESVITDIEKMQTYLPSIFKVGRVYKPFAIKLILLAAIQLEKGEIQLNGIEASKKIKFLVWNTCFCDINKNEKLKPGLKPGDRSDDILNAVYYHDPDVIILTEFGLKSWQYNNRQSFNTSGEKIINDLSEKFEWWQNGGKNNVCDVYIATKKDKFCNQKLVKIRNPKEFSNRWVEIEVESKEGMSLRILGVYVPILGDNERKRKEKAEFWSWLDKFIQNEEIIGENVLIAGDFNEYLELDTECGRSTDFHENLVKMKSNGWCDTWRYKHKMKGSKDPDTWTWISENGNGHRLDYAFVSPKLKDHLLSAEHSHAERACKTSDHSILLVEVDDVPNY